MHTQERLELYLEKRRRDEKLVENMPSDMYENLLRPVSLNYVYHRVMHRNESVSNFELYIY